MISDYFPRAYIAGCDDDGIYYIRQLDEEDRVGDFEGIVWYGQRFEGRPNFANVFIGRLRHGVRFDETGGPSGAVRVDCWEGRFFDVPKGRICGVNDLKIETLTIDVSDFAGGCDFLETYLRRTSSSGFGGRVWPIPLSFCYQAAFDLGRVETPPPAVPPRIGRAYREIGFGDSRIAASLSSSAVTPGFERPSPNLTGQWRGDDQGTYYINEPVGSNDVVWYAEHPLATPFVPGAPSVAARAWANVFWGERSGNTINGLWTDVPRGATTGSGELQFVVEDESLLRMTRVTGGYGGRLLQRVVSRDVLVRVESLTINNSQEGNDEPSIYLSFFKLDGDTVDLDNLTDSTATVESKPQILFGTVAPDSTNLIAEDLGSYRTTLTSIRTANGRDTTNDTRIGVAAYAIERDRATRGSFRDRRYESWMRSQAWALNSALRRGELPSRDELGRNANQILTQFRWGNTDDSLSGELDFVSLRELTESPNIERQIVLRGSGARYTLNIQFEATSRINFSCT